jgi:VIT1/CCC1 family predicted Fe2+/Mn2+ transporter
LFKKNNYNKDFDDNVEQIFSSIIAKYIEHEDIFNNLVNDIKKEYNIYLNNLEKKHMELIKTKTYLIDTQ